MQKTNTSLRNHILWQRVPAGQIQFKELKSETSLLFVYAIVYIISAYVIGQLIINFPMPLLGATDFIQDFWYSVIFKIILLLLIPGLIYFYRWGYRYKDLLYGLRPTFKNISATIAFGLSGFLLNANHLQRIENVLNNFEDAPLRLALGILMPLFVAAIPEELFFRAFLQTRLEKNQNRLIAILISTLLFTLWHLPSRYLLSTGTEGHAGDWISVIIHTGIPVFFVGLFFALHWSRYRNIIFLIAVHWSIDILPSVSSYFKILL